MDFLIGLDVMTTSLLLTMAMKMFFFVFAVVIIQLMLAWMDKRSHDGFQAWRSSIIECPEPLPMAILGIYYCIRYSVLFIWAALLFSS